jgi:hypothetical protein
MENNLLNSKKAKLDAAQGSKTTEDNETSSSDE